MAIAQLVANATKSSTLGAIVNAAESKLDLYKYFHGIEGLFSKSILTNFRFYVTFLNNTYFTKLGKHVGPVNITNLPSKHFNNVNIMPPLEHFHVLNIDIPTSYPMKKEVQHYGAMVRTFTYVEHDGIEFKILFEEDSHGTIAYFINWMQRQIVGIDGLCLPPEQAKIDTILVEIDDDNGIPTMIVRFHKCSFLSSDNMSLNYAGNESIKYNITFDSDWFDYTFLKLPLANL